MTGGHNFWDANVWTFVVTMSILLGSLLFANMLRRIIKPLRLSLIPSSVIAGFIVLGVAKVYEHYTGSPLFDGVTLEALTYHGLGLGMVAMSLRKSGEKVKSKQARTDIFNTGILTVTTYLLQAIVGLAITIGLSYFIGNWMASGILLPMGYGQGPGQAYNWGHNYQTATHYPAFENGTAFGLSVAAMGFIAASVGGVIRLVAAKRKGRVKHINEAESMEDLTAESITDKNEIPLTESLDKLTVQFGLIAVAYAAAYAAMYGCTLLFDKLGGIFQDTVKPTLWGFNFLVGVLFAMLVKGIHNGGRKIGAIKRDYINNFMLTRISGFMFDIMVVSSIAAIDLSAFNYREFVIPLLAVCIVGAIATYVYINFVCKRLFKDYNDESFLAMYGMLTGTASTGLILLREIDPLFETPAANNLVYQNLWAIIFGLPIMLLMGIVPRSTTWTYICLGILVVMYILLYVLLMRKSIFKRKGKNAAETEAAEEPAAQ